MGSLVENLRRNIDAAAVAAACLAVFAGSHAAIRCRTMPEGEALRVGIHRIWMAPDRDAGSALRERFPAFELPEEVKCPPRLHY